MAPMAGITNMAFRKIVKEFGAGLVYSEMVSDKALVYSNEKTFDLLKKQFVMETKKQLKCYK